MITMFPKIVSSKVAFCLSSLEHWLQNMLSCVSELGGSKW